MYVISRCVCIGKKKYLKLDSTLALEDKCYANKQNLETQSIARKQYTGKRKEIKEKNERDKTGLQVSWIIVFVICLSLPVRHTPLRHQGSLFPA